VNEDSLLERVTAAAEDLTLETLPEDRAGEFYEETTCVRSASYHLQVKAATKAFLHRFGLASLQELTAASLTGYQSNTLPPAIGTWGPSATARPISA
jgi:hypothetical protein